LKKLRLAAGSSCQYLSSDAKLADEGAYSDRTIVIKLERLPGGKQQALHLLRVNEVDTIEMKRLP
jgi:hypothetical protein